VTEGRPARPTRGPARFREKDVVRVIRAARKANMPLAAVRIEPDGSILVIPGTPEAVAVSPPNEWDDD
jgi:acetyl/propionyl-CoA carboxylase alpha subunit